MDDLERLDDNRSDTVRRRTPNRERAEFRAVLATIGPLRANVPEWNERGARLEAIARRGNASAEDIESADALLEAVQTAQATLTGLLASPDGASLASSGHVRDLGRSLERLEIVARNARAQLSPRNGLPGA